MNNPWTFPVYIYINSIWHSLSMIIHIRWYYNET